MQRTQISLDAEDRALLDAEARRTGRSMSSLIRDAVRLAYAAPDDAAADIARVEAAFGAWGPGVDGEQYVESIRTGERWKRLDT